MTTDERTTDERALQAMERQATALERIADALAGVQNTLDPLPTPAVR